MIQSFDTQLQVVLRALSDVVAPALNGAEKHVAEQLHLSIATLGFIASRLPQERRYFRMELNFFVDLAEKAASIVDADLVDQSAALRSVAAKGKAILLQPEAETADYQEISRTLREGITNLSDYAEGKPCRMQLDATILRESEIIQTQSRLWCLPFGFELKPDDLPAPLWMQG